MKKIIENRKRKKVNKKVVLGYLLGALFCFSSFATPVFAAEVVNGKFDTLYSLVSAIISNVGIFFLLWGVFEFATAWMGGDGSMQANAFKKMAGGIVAILAPELVTQMR
ncbi:MAG TPA: hypothetical protein VIR32_01385 [Lachnospiraceae bacterium]